MQVTILGRTLESARITDIDAFFFLKIITGERTLERAQARLQELSKKFKVAQGGELEELSQGATEEWSRALLEVLMDADAMDQVARKLIAIYPDIPENWVSYSRDRGGSLRLNAQELLELITPIIGTLNEKSAERPAPTVEPTYPTRPLTPATGFTPSPVVQPVVVAEKIASLNPATSPDFDVVEGLEGLTVEQQQRAIEALQRRMAASGLK